MGESYRRQRIVIGLAAVLLAVWAVGVTADLLSDSYSLPYAVHILTGVGLLAFWSAWGETHG